MYNSRRSFIKKSGLALAGAALLSRNVYAAAATDEIVGLQLYSVRDDMKTDPIGTLHQLAEMGYVYVEHANYVDRKFYGFPATEFKKILTGLGLQMKSGHTVMTAKHFDTATNDFTDVWKRTVDDAATVGQQYVISPWLDDNLHNDYDGLLKFMEVFNKCGTLCKASGMKFGYHNHNFEFSNKLNGVTLYDIILKNTDPALVAQQLDMGNMYGAGGRGADLVKQYPGRFELMHVKDEIKSDKSEMGDGYESTIIGAGVIGTKEIVDLGKSMGGTKQFIIEQESYQGKTPIDCAKEDLKVIKSWGY